MPHSECEDDGYDSVGEDAELELSCALHDLAERVKTFEQNMKGRLRITSITGDEDDEEIGEDIPEVDEDVQSYGYASPKKTRGQRRRGRAVKSKQQDDHEDEEDEYEEDGEEEDDDDNDAKGEAKRSPNNARGDWDEQNERDELCEMKHNISKLLQGFKERAKALDAAVGEENQE